MLPMVLAPDRALRPPAVIAYTWHGRRGSVLLGPTEDRVARYLEDLTDHGRVTIRTVELADRLRLERSEAYRITARLRVLGLFGIENDRAGTRGGRRIWRTARRHDGPGLDPRRHSIAWARVRAWAAARRLGLTDRLEAIRTIRGGSPTAVPVPTLSPLEVPGMTPRAGRDGFAELMRRSGLGALLDEWGVS